jgi:hypothetical protein
VAVASGPSSAMVAILPYVRDWTMRLRERKQTFPLTAPGAKGSTTDWGMSIGIGEEHQDISTLVTRTCKKVDQGNG